MGVIVDFSEFIGKEYGEITNPQGKLAKGIAGAVCEVYNEFPGAWKDANNVVSGFQRGFMKELCRDNPPPPPPQLPECQRSAQPFGTFKRAFKDFDGECGDTGWWRAGIPTSEQNVGFPQPFVEDGRWKVRYKDGTVSPLAPVNQSFYDQNFFGAVPNARLDQVEVTDDCVRGTASAGGDDAQITKIVYSTDVPDYCVDGGQYPEETPPPSITKNVTINLGDNNNFDTTVTIDVDNDNRISYPLNVDVGGVTVNVGLGNITIDPNDDTGGGGGGTTTTFLPKPNPNESDYVVSPPPDVEEEEELTEVEVEDEEIDWVLIEVTTPPVGGKTILHPNPENNTFFAGYFAWVLDAGGAYWLPEQPIRKSRQAFKAPENLTGYRAYTVNGAKIRVTQYKQIIEGEES